MNIRGALARFRSTPDPGNAVTSIRCCACGGEVSEWVAVLWQREQGLPAGEVQPLDGVDIHCWCLPCGEPLKAQVCQAVANAVNPGDKRGRRS